MLSKLAFLEPHSKSGRLLKIIRINNYADFLERSGMVDKNKYFDNHFTNYNKTDSSFFEHDIVYHYTSPSGLDSILQNTSLRFTDCQFLNDKSEYVHLNEIFIKAFNSKKINKDAKLIFNRNIESIKKGRGKPTDIFIDRKNNKIKQYRWYVFCTSTNNDSLQMWNYYIKNDKYEGYNIGLDLKALLNTLGSTKEGTKGLRLFAGAVKYNEKEQIQELIDVVNELSDDFIKKAKNIEKKQQPFIKVSLDEESRKTNSMLMSIVNAKRLFYKKSYFEHEAEYRIVIKIPINETFAFKENKKAFIKQGIFVPYIDMKIGKELIRKITLSPVFEKDIACQGLSRYLGHNGYRDVDIEQSKIPVRY